MTASPTTSDKRSQFEERSLRHATSLARTPDGWYVFKRLSKVLKQYTRLELLQMEPRLIVFVDKPILDVKAFYASWSFWKNTDLPIYRCNHVNAYALSQIRSIYQNVVLDGPIKCRVDHYNLELFGDIWFATGQKTNTLLLLPPSWFETTYPGAMTRIRVARELGFTPEEVAAYAVNVGNTVVPAALPVDVCFDVDVTH